MIRTTSEMTLILACVVLFLITSSVSYAQQTDQQYNQARPCNINVQFNEYPVYYNEGRRQNPDGTTYPGDAIHYIFSFRGSDTCTSFGPNTIESQGAMNLTSHNVSSGVIHLHQKYDIIPKNITTTHYYKILDENTKCIVHHRGGTRTCTTHYTLSDNPIYSIREDEELTKRQWRAVSMSISDSTSRILRDDIKLEYTHAMNFTKVPVHHTHQTHSHAREDAHSIEAFDTIVKQLCNNNSNINLNSGCVYGHAEIDTVTPHTKCLIAELNKRNIKHDIKTEDDYCIEVLHELSLTVQGYATEQQKDSKGNTVFVPVLVEKTVQAPITVLEPTPDVIFEHPPIMDKDGYGSKNEDGTYYVWDLPAIHTIPELKFRDIRNNTISFVITRLNSPISNVFTDTCTKDKCIINVQGDDITDTPVNAINGDRLDVDTAPTLHHLGLKNFSYRIQTYNIDQVISDVTAETDILIVDYSPVYDEDIFAYTILDTDGNTTFEKHLGLASHYLGSNGTGPDDINIIHEHRRSKINDSVHAIHANNPFDAYFLNSTVVMQGGNDITDITSSVYESVLDKSGKSVLGDYNMTLQSNNNTVLFTKEGFGRLSFSHDIIDEISQFSISNVTGYNTVMSSEFGGYEKKYLMSWVYDYPVAFVSSVLNVTAIQSDGSIDGAVPIKAQLHVVINNETDKTAYLPYYMASHIRNAGHHEEYVEMYLGDMYNVDNTVNGNGVAATIINMPAVRIISDIWGILNITENDKSFTSLDERLSLSSPVVYRLDITTDKATNTMYYPAYGFDSPMTYSINADDSNTLEHIRYLSTVHVRSPENFGEIKRVTVNGAEYGASCRHGCLLAIDGDTVITAENIWGGKATLYVPQQTWNGTASQYDIVVSYIDNVTPYVIVILLAFTAVFMYGRLSQS